MLKFIIRWLTTAVGIGTAGYLLPGIEVDDIWAAVLGALALGLVNVTLHPIILLLALPLTLLTLGAFALIVNGVCSLSWRTWFPVCMWRVSGVLSWVPLLSAWLEAS
jgi:uncharacterized membrane protein YvlD (DUF360 family)